MKQKRPPKKSPEDHTGVAALPEPHNISALLKCLHELSEEDLTKEMQMLWGHYVESIRDSELRDIRDLKKRPDIREEDLNRNPLGDLVVVGWIRRSPVPGEVIFEGYPKTDPVKEVPIVLFFSDGEFHVPWIMLSYLILHPLIRTDGGSSIFNHRIPAEKFVADTLQKVHAIAESYGTDLVGLAKASEVLPDTVSRDPKSTKQDDSLDRENTHCGDAAFDRRAADCGDAALDLIRMLQGMVRKEDQSLKWLTEAKECDHFWELLKSSIILGMSLERRRIFDEIGAESELRASVYAPRGKNKSAVGYFFERMIQTYILRNGEKPTAQKLLEWSGVEKGPPKTKKVLYDLIFENSKWPPECHTQTINQFRQNVKDAISRMSRRSCSLSFSREGCKGKFL